MEENKLQPEPLLDTSVASCSINPSDGKIVLKYKKVEAGEAVKKGTKLRILPVGDSITVGYLSDRKGGDGNGYRGQLKKDLSGKQEIFRHHFQEYYTKVALQETILCLLEQSLRVL